MLVVEGESKHREWHSREMGLQRSRVGSLDEQESAGVSGVLTGGGGVLSPHRLSHASLSSRDCAGAPSMHSQVGPSPRLRAASLAVS